MTIESVNLTSLKQVKNTVIGNPSAKITLARDERFVQTLVQCLNQPAPPSDRASGSQDDIRIEAAHVLSSLSYGIVLLNARAVEACLHAISCLQPHDSNGLKSAFSRSLRSLATAVAEVVGPSQWGLRPEGSSVRDAARDALECFFHPNSLDVYLPMLVDSSPQTSISIAQLLASAVRTGEHRDAITEWLPPVDRIKESKGKRGWEKPAVVNSNAPGRQGGWVARNLAALLRSRDSKLQEAALYALSALSKDNDKIAALLVKPVSDRDLPSTLSSVLSLAKSRSTDVQLAACLCATHIIRASPTNHSSTSDELYIQNIVAVLNRIISSSASEALQTRSKACFILYNLISDDPRLCQFAHERGSLDQLATVVKDITPSEVQPEWDEDEPESLSSLREAALTTISAMSLFDDNIRREVADEFELLPLIQSCMTHRHVGVRYASCQCVRAISRSVAVLRTSLVDSGLGLQVFEIFKKEEEDRRVTSAALAAVCNLLNDFCPLRPILMEKGLLPRLIQVLGAEDRTLRLSSLWAFKNLLLRTLLETKKTIMGYLKWSELTRLMADPEHGIQEQAFNVLRNIAEDEPGIELIFRELDAEMLLQSLTACMSSPDPTMEDVILQAVCTLGNLFNGSESHQRMIVSHPMLLKSLRSCLAHDKAEIRRPAASCILSIVRSSSLGPSRSDIVEAGIVSTLRHICEWSGAVAVSPGGRSSTHHAVIEDDKEVVDLARQALQCLEHVGSLNTL
ncbi:hypothetical protein CCMSSC00406_0003336 [Pleurotus cornucopiae]|uniref:Uncharacterized protein n=1 Tax=Pleurotus cornucopiae TaxID=5321 RepID=A0ACB7J7G7_PLECO|nr:hypothetical protein CCMSSC00406_0003336 [Pleurotus cornucopiae]